MSPARKGAKTRAKKTAKRTTKKTANAAVKKSAKSAVKKAAKKVAKKAVRNVAKMAVKTAAKTPARTVAKKSARTSPKQPAVAPALDPRALAKAEKRGRAQRRQAHLAERRGVTDMAALSAAMGAAVRRVNAARVAAAPSARRGRPGPRDVATSNTDRWIPLGPSVVRRGQADGRPRVTGRIRDLAVDDTGRRAYAGSGKAGVWYTEDAGTTWRPIGGHVNTAAAAGGLSTDLSCGCLLVQFGANATEDYVMVGTGEMTSINLVTEASPSHDNFGGRGVLAGRAPAMAAETAAPFEPDTGIALLENTSISRLARDPAKRTTALAGALGDRVLAAADSGLYLGTRASVLGDLTWQWTKVAGLDPLLFTTIPVAGVPTPVPTAVTDVQWVPVAGNDNGRIFVAIAREGVIWSDALGAAGSWNWVGGLNRATDGIRVSGAHVISELLGDRIYVLHGRHLNRPVGGRDDAAFLNRIPNATRTIANGGPGASERVPGVPDALWGAQRFWDQAICVDRVAGVDRVWVGGSGITPYTGADFSAAIYCFDVQETGANAPRLIPATGVSRMAQPPAGEGANISALAGNSIHADVHVIRSIAMADGTRHVWTGTDGGVYVSERNGRVNTFAPRVTGLAIVEAGYVAAHPTSSQYCVLGAQDNGSQARTGDTVWELIQMGDGGGQLFHPGAPQFIVSQFTDGTWFSAPIGGFVDPLSRTVGGNNNTGDAESDASMFYSGCDAIATTPGAGRIAIGTTRVWISDDLGVRQPNTWNVIRHDTATPRAASDPRPGGANAAPARGVPVPAVGPVVQVRWATTAQLYAVFQQSIVRHDEAPAGTWSTTVVLGAGSVPDPTRMRVTDLAPIPGTNDFYFTTLGDAVAAPAVPMETCWVCIGGVCTATGLRTQLVPNDPANAICLDPEDASIVYVGTLGGVWKGVRSVAPDGTVSYDWNPFMNGMPITCVSDLRIWRTPGVAAANPAPLKLLRAATQSRGVWEVNLAAAEPPRTWLRVHARDDRRVLPSPMADPRLATTAAPEVAFASPDLVVRPAPRASATAALRFPFRDDQVIGRAESGSFHLWEFQTAFRWLFPAVRADGLWTDQLADLIRLHRASSGLGAGSDITKATWDDVVGGTHLTAAREVRRAAADHWAVYETPWQMSGAVAGIATEVDTLELVQPQRVRAGIWHVQAGSCRVDVTVHHRDTRPVAADGAYTALFWRSATDETTLLAALADPFDVLHGWNGAATVPTPAGWNRVTFGGSSVHRLPVALDAFMPRAISIDLDLSGVAVGDHVLMVAVCGSSAENAPAPAGLVAGASTVVDLVRAWPRAAMRLIRVTDARRVVT